MKKLIIYTIITLLFIGCKEEPKRTDYLIKGTAKDIYNGIRVHLNKVDEKGKERTIGTRMVVNEEFTFEGSVDAPDLYYLTINSVPGKLPLMLENSEIKIEIDKTKLADSKITGSKSQNDYGIYQSGLKAIDKEMQPIRLRMRKAMAERNGAMQDSLSQQMEALITKKTDYTLDVIQKHKDDFFSLFLIRQQLNDPNMDVERYRNAFNSLSSSVKSSKDGRATQSRLESLYKIYMRTANLEIGKVAPNFEAPNPEGKPIALDDIKGKVTIIDFWAAWCGPCRRENPNVVRIYNKYHDQGLEIIGVSLDGSRNQKDPKKAWLDAIEKDKLTWTQVSNLQYFNDPVAQLYNITSIPATYILDKDGKIVSKNLRGRALELKVEELIKS